MTSLINEHCLAHSSAHTVLCCSLYPPHMVVCRILVGVPNGTPLSTDSVTRPGYVMSCSLTSDPRCMPFRGSDTGNDRRLYDVDGEKASK